MNKCFKCGHEFFNEEEDGFTSSGMDSDGEAIWENYTCDKCGFSWNAVYMFSHYEEADSLEIIPCKR